MRKLITIALVVIFLAGISTASFAGMLRNGKKKSRAAKPAQTTAAKPAAKPADAPMKASEPKKDEVKK